jgi:hypothetical protein
MGRNISLKLVVPFEIKKEEAPPAAVP